MPPVLGLAFASHAFVKQPHFHTLPVQLHWYDTTYVPAVNSAVVNVTDPFAFAGYQLLACMLLPVKSNGCHAPFRYA